MIKEYISKEKLYKLVDEKLAMLGIREENYPLDAVSIAKSIGPSLEVERHRFPTNKMGGILYKGEEISSMALNTLRSEKGQNFDCMHELIHYWFHPPGNNICIDDNYIYQNSGIEWQANEGAAQALMPQKLFIKKYMEFEGDVYMSEFWEKSFAEKQAMWGFEPSSTAIIVADYFAENNLKDILIPGIGYGRNAKPFIHNNMEVTGIEISQTAINIARQNGINNKIYHGSVSDMPFENKLYNGVASFALIHLLNEDERKKFINDCYNHLKPGGYMIFTAISEKAPMYGNGTKLAENYYETTYEVKLFFYDSKSIEKEFGNYGLVDFVEIDDIYKENPDKPPINFLMIKCRKEI